MNAYDIVKSALDDLPDDPDEIAAKLQANGIRSVPRCPMSCAIANYLQERLSAAGFTQAVRVNTRTASVRHSFEVELPYAATVFIGRFDSGQYPMIVDVERTRVKVWMTYRRCPDSPVRFRQLARLDEIERIQKENA